MPLQPGKSGSRVGWQPGAAPVTQGVELSRIACRDFFCWPVCRSGLNPVAHSGSGNGALNRRRCGRFLSAGFCQPLRITRSATVPPLIIALQVLRRCERPAPDTPDAVTAPPVPENAVELPWDYSGESGTKGPAHVARRCRSPLTPFVAVPLTLHPFARISRGTRKTVLPNAGDRAAAQN